MYFNYLPIEYDEPLFRPPSEADSIILQVSFGCSWNRCAFCDMYATKKFAIKPIEKVLFEIDELSKINLPHRKLFLADGNPLVLKTEHLIKILTEIKVKLPRIRRVTTYATARDIFAKTETELKELKDAGLSMIYIGIESGDNEVLKMINKGETFESTRDGLLKAKAAGIKLSTIIINGVAGKNYWQQHAINSAKILNATQPEFASSLVLSFPFNQKHYQDKFKGEYQKMNNIDLFEETKLFIENCNLQNTIYRSNHASNYLVLSGILSKDKLKFIEQINFAINSPSLASLRQEWQRGL